jgi:hypothetical protein
MSRIPFVVTLRKPLPCEATYDYIGEFRYLPGPCGLPLLKPPFASLIAIDMNTGDARSHATGMRMEETAWNGGIGRQASRSR